MQKTLILLLCLAANIATAQTNYLLAQGNGVRATVSYTQVYVSFNATVTVQNFSANSARVKICVDFEGDTNDGCDNFTNGHEIFLGAGSSRSFRYWGQNSDRVVRYTVHQFSVTGGEPSYASYNQPAQIYQYGYYNGVPAPSALDVAAVVMDMEKQKEREKERKAKGNRSIFAQNLSDGKTTISPAAGINTVYYFMVTADSETGGCSNVFAVHQHSDGSWPFFSDIKQKIAAELYLAPTNIRLIGYFENEDAAQTQQQNTLRQMEGLNFKIVPYSAQSTNQNTQKKAKIPAANDGFWGNDAKAPAKPIQSDSTKTKRNYWD